MMGDTAVPLFAISLDETNVSVERSLEQLLRRLVVPMASTESFYTPLTMTLERLLHSILTFSRLYVCHATQLHLTTINVFDLQTVLEEHQLAVCTMNTTSVECTFKPTRMFMTFLFYTRK